ncbi:MAG: class I SAM-dependent methyltransferase [Kofleriaceae bacterium]
MTLWADRVLPFLIEKAGRSHAILAARQRWIPRARGQVLEVGVGSGLNLALYDPTRVTRVIALDPSRALLARAAPRAAEARVPVTLVRGDAQALPYADATFDTIVMTYTLCSIDDPLRALGELRRVLRGDGELLFVEHGISHVERTGRWQRRLTPYWKRIAGGCHLDRDTGDLLRRSGFTSDDLTAEAIEGARLLSFTYQGSAHITR